ncbi:MAG: hypothetical protein MRERC_16c009 [Mycoplasmataceae bacterium RC_NB112A]|nr:MAG: hypothetical protein MRERC_16c009 [Mycoplasmataceae bacterium RC_NB112A]
MAKNLISSKIQYITTRGALVECNTVNLNKFRKVIKQYIQSQGENHVKEK